MTDILKIKRTFTCPQCSAVFSRAFSRNRHLKVIHLNTNQVHVCQICGEVFTNVKKLKEHRALHEPTTGFYLLNSAFRKSCLLYRKIYSTKMKTLEQSFANDKKDMITLLQHEVTKKNSLKATIIYHAEFLKSLDDMELGETTYPVCIRTKATQLNNTDEILKFVRNSRLDAQERIDDFIEHGSGWVLDEIVCTDIQIGVCSPLNGSCSKLSIKYFNSLKKIKYTTKNRDCFFEAIAFHFIDTIDMDDIQTFISNQMIIKIDRPVKVSAIAKFERDNSHLNCKINVMYAEEQDIYPLYVSKNTNAENQINLLLYKTLINDKVVDHYLYVEDLNILLRKSYRGLNKHISYEKSIRCPNCLQKFTSKLLYKEHEIACFNNKPQKIVLPNEGDILKFTNFNNKYVAPYVGFFDFEACQKKPEHQCAKCGCHEGNCKHKTTISTLQEPTTYSVIIVETETNTIINKNTYTGSDCAKHLIDYLLTIEESILSNFDKFPKHNMNVMETKMLENAITCHICELDFEIGELKVGDHCHTTGKFYGAAHNVCNLNRQVKTKIPMFCHNLQGYDSHFIMKCLESDKRIHHVEGLSYNTEKFRTITINTFIFLDSLSFLSASLSELVNDLSKNELHSFHILDQMNLYGRNEKKKKEMLKRKGVYPYEIVESIEMLQKMKKIPPQKAFYSSLTDSSISEEEYKHAKKVFKKFKCKNLLEYTELYCATDVALLAEVMLQFRAVVQSEFGLDCCHYISAPQLAFDLMLKSTKVEIELLTDIDQVLFVEQNIRGKKKILDIFQICNSLYS